MGKRLIDLTTPEDRKRALDSTERLDDVRYPKTFEGDALPFVDSSQLIDTDEPLNSKNIEYDYWSKVARVALMRFPKLCKGERIRVKELKKRLEKIKNTGYNVKSYNKMNQKELWDYNMQIRAKVYREAEKACPEIVEEINAINQGRN